MKNKRFRTCCSWGALGRSWGAFGRSWALLGRSWVALGPLFVALGPLLAALGPLLGALGRSWAALGRSWSALGTTCKNHQKIDAKNDRFGPPKASQNDSKIGPKIDRKSMQKTKRKKHLFKIVLAPFWGDLGSFCDRSWGHVY